MLAIKFGADTYIFTQAILIPDLIGFATIIKEGEFRVEELAADEVLESTIKNIRAKIQNIKKNEKLL